MVRITRAPIIGTRHGVGWPAGPFELFVKLNRFSILNFREVQFETLGAERGECLKIKK